MACLVFRCEPLAVSLQWTSVYKSCCGRRCLLPEQWSDELHPLWSLVTLVVGFFCRF